MLSDSNVRKINKQIEEELKTVSRMFTSDEDKAAALDRISQLKSILDDNPVAIPEDCKTDEISELIREFISALRRR